jgi:hypothetical protein
MSNKQQSARSARRLSVAALLASTVMISPPGLRAGRADRTGRSPGRRRSRLARGVAEVVPANTA